MKNIKERYCENLEKEHKLLKTENITDLYMQHLVYNQVICYHQVTPGLY